jgi:hypothetical protein
LSAFCSRADDNLSERITRSVRRIRRVRPRSSGRTHHPQIVLGGPICALQGDEVMTTKLEVTTHELLRDEAYALAEMCKRMTWDDFKKLSVDRFEHDAMDRATLKIPRALAEAGIEVR